MSFLESYLSELQSDEIRRSVRNTVSEFIDEKFSDFTYKDHVTGLLIGEVQSGKTGQLLGITSALADEGIQLFILLTSDNIKLQNQTFTRSQNGLKDFLVCDETDYQNFISNQMRKPVLLVLKKNHNVLESWYNNLSQSGIFNAGRPIIIIDDEADSYSLNTKVNKHDQSTINRHLQNIKRISTSSLYLQVTATPQPIVLQTIQSGSRPEFIQYFSPGSEYIGGNFFYSDPPSFVVRPVPEDELDNVRTSEDYITEALRNAISVFLLTSSHIFIKEEKSVCNFLVHPSIRINDHNSYANEIGSILNEMLFSHNEDTLREYLIPFWDDLQRTKPDICRFERSYTYIVDLLENQRINILLFNSKSSSDVTFHEGINILIGGNSLGRGVTIPGLQTIYYTRSAKKPNADTFWQHCRMFGYDRDRNLMRYYLPESLLRMFIELNSSHNAFIHHLRTKGIDGIKLVYPENISPTRKNVVDKKLLSTITGGVSYFPGNPKNKSLEELDSILMDYQDPEPIDVSVDTIVEILSLIQGDNSDFWNTQSFLDCINLIQTKDEITNGKLIVRLNRDLRRGTGTMLSENDRLLVAQNQDELVLVMYRLTGTKEKFWDGSPLWMPNINLPDGVVYYHLD